jgi:rhamnulokinase
MRRTPDMALLPVDKRALIAVDLGAESCRVSLLRWIEGKAVISLVHRFANAPREVDGGLRWDLGMIEVGLDYGVRQCAAIAEEGVRSIAVDGWAVDYVRVDSEGKALADPFCYRDERTIKSERLLHRKISPEKLRELTGIQLMRINTLYQLHADALQGLPEGRQWLNLPEYILSRWGGARVAEHTNATHTQMVELYNRQWCREIFHAAHLDLACAAKIVPPGTEVGRLSGLLAELPALRDTMLIAPACHDTASAIAGIPAVGDDWAYISSGTWSLVGTLVDKPVRLEGAETAGFTNLAASGGRTCFHANLNGMWPLRQCMEQWQAAGGGWTIEDLVRAAESLEAPDALLRLDEPEMQLPGEMMQRINAQLRAGGHAGLKEDAAHAPQYANLIFHSLAARYREVLEVVSRYTGKKLKRAFIVGGGSKNAYLNRLIGEATGLEVNRGSAESSTIGSFAIQLAVLEGGENPGAEAVYRFARSLQDEGVGG